MVAKKTVRKNSAAQPQKTCRKPKLSDACATYRSRDGAGMTNKDYALDVWIRMGGICTPDDVKPRMNKKISDNVIASWLSGFDRGGAHPGYPRTGRTRTTEILATLKNIGVTDTAMLDNAKRIKNPAEPLQIKHVAKKTVKKTPKRKPVKK